MGDEETPGIGIDVGYGAVEVSGVTVRDSSYVGLWVESGDVIVRDGAIMSAAYVGVVAPRSGSGEMTDLSLEGCLIDGNTTVGLIASDPGTHVTLRDTTLKDTRPDTNGEFGRGIQVNEGATLFAEGCLVDGNTELGLYASNPGTQVRLWETIIKDTQPNANGEGGKGIEVTDSATLSAKGCLFDGNTELGLFAFNPGTEVTLRDTTVKDTKPNANGEFGLGIDVGDGATLATDGCLIEGNVVLGLYAHDPGTEITLRNTTIGDTQSHTNGTLGLGIQVSGSATLVAESCLLDGNSEGGLAAGDSGTQVTLLDVAVKDSRPNADGQGGYGVEVLDGANLSADGCIVEENTDNGVIAIGSGTAVMLWGTVVRNTIVAQDGASLTVEKSLVVGSYGIGVYVLDPDTKVGLFDTTVMDVQSDAIREGGYGIQVGGGASLFVDGCVIEGNTEIGLNVVDPGTQVIVRNTMIKDTLPTVNNEGGYGIQAHDGASLHLDGCVIDGNTELGLLASAPGTEVKISDSTISGTKPGTDLMASAAFGVDVQKGAFLFASHLVVVANQGPGFLVDGSDVDGAWMECTGCTIEGNQFAGAAALRGGTLSISDSTIESTSANVNLLGGVGVYAWSWDGAPPTVTLTNNLIQDNPIAGVWLIGNGTYVLTDNTISGGIGEPFGSGSRCGDAILARDGVTVWDGTSGLLLQDNVFQDASGSGILLDGSSALMSGNAYSNNAVDLVVQNQSCDPIPAWYSEAPQHEFCPPYSYPTCYAEFFYVAMPSDPVDWEDDKALRPRFLTMNPIASPARPIPPISPTTRLDHPSLPLSLPR